MSGTNSSGNIPAFANFEFTFRASHYQPPTNQKQIPGRPKQSSADNRSLLRKLVDNSEPDYSSNVRGGIGGHRAVTMAAKSIPSWMYHADSIPLSVYYTAPIVANTLRQDSAAGIDDDVPDFFLPAPMEIQDGTGAKAKSAPSSPEFDAYGGKLIGVGQFTGTAYYGVPAAVSRPVPAREAWWKVQM
ncbi:hypothetical protein LTR17_005504 [Elasticomyces elasticus]|nr:hypothetical protein LTR17_005504 [Elasticomyces elasticus]